MSYYAIIENNKVVNVIVAESQDIAEKATNLSAIETTGVPWINWTLEDGSWRPPSPYPSWIWQENSWVAPIPMPEDENVYVWDEDSQNWKIKE